MTIGQIIATTAAMKPNAYTEKQIAEWVIKLEHMIESEIMGYTLYTQLVYPDDASKPLLAPILYNDIYAKYVSSMIDFSNMEFSSYANTIEIFNETFDSFAKWYRRRHIPIENEIISVKRGVL